MSRKKIKLELDGGPAERDVVIPAFKLKLYVHSSFSAVVNIIGNKA
jgi:hypothetical protein